MSTTEKELPSMEDYAKELQRLVDNESWEFIAQMYMLAHFSYTYNRECMITTEQFNYLCDVLAGDWARIPIAICNRLQLEDLKAHTCNLVASEDPTKYRLGHEMPAVATMERLLDSMDDVLLMEDTDFESEIISAD